MQAVKLRSFVAEARTNVATAGCGALTPLLLGHTVHLRSSAPYL